MDPCNYVEITFPSHACNEAFARSAIACFVAQLDPTLEEMGDIRTAVSEAVSNCIIHAYPNEVGVITLCYRILKNNVISIMIKDRGVGIQGVPEEHKGLGFARMERCMTNLKVVSVPGKGTTVYMKRKIEKARG